MDTSEAPVFHGLNDCLDAFSFKAEMGTRLLTATAAATGLHEKQPTVDRGGLWKIPLIESAIT